MIVAVSAEGKVTLQELDDFRRFHLVPAARAQDAGLDGALHSVGARRDGDHALIPQEWLRAQGADRGGEWRDGFDAMVKYAGSKGWVDLTGAVRAHIEWPCDA